MSTIQTTQNENVFLLFYTRMQLILRTLNQ